MIPTKKSVALAVAACLVLGIGYYLYQKKAAASPEQRYKTHTLGKGDVTQTVSANGTLNPVTLVSVGTQVSGTVKKLHVNFNDQVKAGQVLAELDDALYWRRCGRATPAWPVRRLRCSWRAPARRA